MDSPIPAGSQTPLTVPPEVLAVYGRYIELTSWANHPAGMGGKLLLCCGLEPAAFPILLAGSIAGAASLALDSDAALVRQAVRERACEFLVNSLSEAVRILKNELRKRQPVAVCVGADLSSCLGEMLERGIQPDLIAASGGRQADPLVAQFRACGAEMLVSPRLPERNGWVDAVWRVEEETGLWLPKIDALFEALIPGDPRNRWLRRAPLYLHRALRFQRFVRLTRSEAGAFLAALRNAVASGGIGVAVTIDLGDGEQVLTADR